MKTSNKYLAVVKAINDDLPFELKRMGPFGIEEAIYSVIKNGKVEREQVAFVIELIEMWIPYKEIYFQTEAIEYLFNLLPK